MEERAEGIVLRLRPLTETSLIVHWLTRSQGRIATVAKGARRPKSPFAGKLDLFYRARFSYQRSRRSELHTLREVSLLEDHPALRRDVVWLCQAAYAGTLIELASETETPVEELFELWGRFLACLPSRPPGYMAVIGWEIQLLAVSGFAPRIEETPVSEGARRLLRAAVATDWPAILVLEAPPGVRTEVSRCLGVWIREAFGRVPRQRDGALAGVTG